MKEGRSLAAVLLALEAQEKEKRDYVSPASSLHLENDGYTISMGERQFHATELFHSQVAAALNIPGRYYGLMQKEKPELLADNVNAWMSGKPGKQKYMIRTLGRNARALLSDRYRRIDNLEVASAVLPLFAGIPDIEVMSCEVTPSRLYLKIVNHRLEMACVGDRIQAGVMISNSEVGLGAVVVQPLIYTLACTNGMVVNSLRERKTHVGRVSKEQEGYEVFRDETKKAEDTAFLMRLQDVTRAAIDEARFGEIVKTLEKSEDAKITGRVPDVVELSGKEYGLSQGEQDGVLKYLISGGDLSLYGLSNAVTRQSQDVDSYDRATELEGIGWKMATMGNAKWEAINK